MFKKEILIPIGIVLVVFLIILFWLWTESNKKVVSTTLTQNNYTEAFNTGDYETANKILDEKLEKNYSDTETLISKANTLLQQASLEFREKELGDQAKTYLARALAIDANNVVALTLMGYANEIQEKYTDAHKYYDQAIALDANYLDAYIHKAHSYYLQGKIDEAEANYLIAAEINPNSIETKLGLALIDVFKDRLPEAKSKFLEVANFSQNLRQVAESYQSAAAISEQIKPLNLNEIENLVNKAIAADPKYPLSYVTRAKVLFAKALETTDDETQRNLVGDSFESLGTAIKLNSNQSAAYLQMAIQLKFGGAIADAKIMANNLPKIINNDISLSSIDKAKYLEIVKNFKEELN